MIYQLCANLHIQENFDVLLPHVQRAQKLDLLVFSICCVGEFLHPDEKGDVQLFRGGNFF